MVDVKLLVVSDSHLYADHLKRVVNHYMSKVDYMIHCGDSSLPLNDSYIQKFDVVVKGNHDDAPFPIYQTFQHICVTHGHCYGVYYGYEQLIQLCQKENCYLCLHGHTHVPTIQKHQDITFVNPGSLMMNRGSYGYGTYALIDVNGKDIHVEFHHCITDALCQQDILDEGMELLEEFKQLLK